MDGGGVKFDLKKQKTESLKELQFLLSWGDEKFEQIPKSDGVLWWVVLSKNLKGARS